MGKKRFLILGIDGLDPILLEKFIQEGNLPTFSRLIKTKIYKRLMTTDPPQSPVAWESFVTGKLPSEHKFLDFLSRDPKTYLPFKTIKNKLAHNLLQKISKNDYTVCSLFLPQTFPPSRLNGVLLSGMGVPDILGTDGSPAFYSQQKHQPGLKGRNILLGKAFPVKTLIYGPKVRDILGKIEIKTLPFTITKIHNQKIKIFINNKQTINLKVGEFSSWIKESFPIGAFKKISFIFKFFLKSIDPLIFYVSPLNIDPNEPTTPISYPKNYAKNLAQKYNLFSTLGLPYDTWALDYGFITDDAFIKNIWQSTDQVGEIMMSELDKNNPDVFVGYFGAIDSLSHMYFKNMIDPTDQYKTVLYQAYHKMDDWVKTFWHYALKTNRELIILSDHGFAQFDFTINLNSWLVKNGYLKTKSLINRPLFEGVDWSNTQAYAVGFNSIFLNIQGRESQGIVTKENKQNVLKKLIHQLENIHYKGKRVIKLLHLTGLNEGPDIIVGFKKGFRQSWEGAVGQIEKDIIKKRTGHWSGDHMFDASEIPGVFISTFPVTQKLHIKDVLPLVISHMI